MHKGVSVDENEPGLKMLTVSPEVAGFQSVLRAKLEAANTRHLAIHYDALFLTVPQRGLGVWVNEIVPELGMDLAPAFERSLASVGMRAAKSIPWIVAFGYAFGVSCHAFSGANAARRHEAGVIAGLNMLLLSLLDRLIDEHPAQFSFIKDYFTRDSIEAWVIKRQLPDRLLREDAPVAAGLIELYRIYLTLGYGLLDRSLNKNATQAIWLEALLHAHLSESASADRKMSACQPSPEMVENCAVPSVAGAWEIAVSCCLAESVDCISSTKPFAEMYGMLTWMVDDVSDIRADISNDIWNGLSARLALAGAEAEKQQLVLLDYESRCTAAIHELYQMVSRFKWDENDEFSLADILWAYIWAWLGGQASWFNVSR